MIYPAVQVVVVVRAPSKRYDTKIFIVVVLKLLYFYTARRALSCATCLTEYQSVSPLYASGISE